MSIPDKALTYFDSGPWCKHILGQVNPAMPRCTGGSLNLALSDGRSVQWRDDHQSWQWYKRLADIMREQFPERRPLLIDHVDDIGFIEFMNDHSQTKQADMRLCLEKLRAHE